MCLCIWDQLSTNVFGNDHCIFFVSVAIHSLFWNFLIANISCLFEKQMLLGGAGGGGDVTDGPALFFS